MGICLLMFTSSVVAMDYPILACENVIYIHLMERQGMGVALVLYLPCSVLDWFDLACTASRFRPVPWTAYTVLCF
jgi:hypothetical protein